MVNAQELKGNSASETSNQKHMQEILEVSKVLSIISKFDALILLSKAKDSMESAFVMYSKLGMTRKQYYTRLMQLKEAGLIEKRGRFYFQTTKGSFLYENCVNPIIHAIKNGKYMAMIDILAQTEKFQEDDLSKVKSVICNMRSMTLQKVPDQELAP